MIEVRLGENSKATARAADRSRIQDFYRDVLGCNVIIKEDSDVVWLGRSFHIAVRYEDNALSDEELLSAIWLELRTDRPEELKKRIVDFGIKGIDFRDKEHFYFQAPGGQVFRLVGNDEDMSKWRR